MLCFQRTDENCRLLGALRVRLGVPAGVPGGGGRGSDEILKMCPGWLNEEEESSKSGRVGGLIPCAENVRMLMRVLFC